MPPKAKGPSHTPIISSADFRGKSVLNDNDLEKLLIDSPADIANKISNWESYPIIALVAQLNNTNTDITDCNVVLIGDFFENERRLITANNYWNDSQGVTISIGKLQGSLFTFSGGALFSNLVDSSYLDVIYTKNGIVTSAQELGIPGFSLRFYITPSDSTWARFYLVLYPLPLATLQQAQPLHLSPHLPGYKAYYGDLVLAPRSTHLLKKSFGCPVAPQLIRGSDAPVSSEFITGQKLKAAVAATLRSAVKPDTNKGYSHLVKRWDSILQHGESQLKPQELEVIWPSPPAPAVVQPQGNPGVKFRFSATVLFQLVPFFS